MRSTIAVNASFFNTQRGLSQYVLDATFRKVRPPNRTRGRSHKTSGRAGTHGVGESHDRSSAQATAINSNVSRLSDASLASGHRKCFPPAVTQFRLQPHQLVSLAATFVDALRTNRNAARPAVQDRCTHPRNSSLRSHSPGQRMAFSGSLPSRLQLLLACLACLTTHSRKAQGGAIAKNG